MKLWPLALLFVSIGVFAESPRSTVEQDHPAQPKTQLDAEEAQARAWFRERRQEHPDLKQVAEGKYLISDEDTTPEATSSSDVWTLWKSPDGQWEVTGTLEFSDESVPYWIELTPRMRPAVFKVFRRETTIGCRRTPSTLLCEETNSHGLVLRTAQHEINGPTEIFMPMPFFWAGLARSSEFHGDEVAQLTLLAQGGETETFPVSFSPIDASLRVLRRGKYPILQSEMDAAEFQLAARDPSEWHPHNPHDLPNPPGPEPQQPYSPMMELWVSSDGILLFASSPNTREGFVRLVQFKKLAGF
jgi:hypothetical protein